MKVPSARDVLLFFEAILFTVLVPGTVTVWIPWWIVGPAGHRLPSTWTGIEVAALVPLAMGGLIYLWCLWDFASRGRGIPAPIDHPEQLVVIGAYGYVRNPMYVGVLLILIGEVVFFGSQLLLIYAAAWFLVVNLVVLLYEEPALRRKFGPSYERYTAKVGRWVPRRPDYRALGDHMTRLQMTFAALVLAQAAHSVEEYLGRLWESFPPAQFLTGLVSQDRRQGFLMINISLVAFGVWCLLWPIRRQWKGAIGLAWLWIGIELINGTGHPLWSLSQRGYTPGVITAPLLLILALYMAAQLRSAQQAAA